MPASFCAEDSTTKGPPARAPLAMPMEEAFSTTMTLLPAREASTAANMPAAPAPAMTMSASRVSLAASAVASVLSALVSSARATPALMAATAAVLLAATKLRRVISIAKPLFS